MPRVNLPPGCMGFKAQDGTRYVARPGTHVEVDERHMSALKSQDYAQAGLVTSQALEFISDPKKQGRWCVHCNRLWHAWSKVCSKCGEETVPESELDKGNVTMSAMFPEYAPIITEPPSEGVASP